MIAFLTISLVIVLQPKDGLRMKNSVIAVFPCVSKKNYLLHICLYNLLDSNDDSN